MSVQQTHRYSILAVGDFPEGGATSQRLYLLAKLMNKGLGETSIWILHPTCKEPLPENHSINGNWNGINFNYLSGTTVRPSSTLGALVDTLKGIIRCIYLLINRNSNSPDVLVVYTPIFIKFILPMLLARFLHVPLVVESCEIPSQAIDRLELGNIRRWVNSGESLMERLIPKFAVGVLAISHGIMNYYKQQGLAHDAAYLLPVLIDAEHYENCTTTPIKELVGQRFLLNSGSFNEKDGLQYLVSAVARVVKDFPDIKLVFTGSSNKQIQEKVLNMAGKDGHRWIYFTGFIARDELIWCYKNAQGLLSCRSNSGYANYGFPTKLAEYLASGIPVVATTVGDVERYLKNEESAFLAAPENIDSISQAIRRLLDAPEHAKNVGRRGAQVARQVFDYQNYIVDLASFIQRRI